MARDYFATLGLAPGSYDPRKITSQFQQLRAELLAQLDRPNLADETHRKLDELHIAYSALSEAAQAERLKSTAPQSPNETDAAASLRQLIRASIEDGLLRYSRRREILQEARSLGFSDFQTHVLIAQVQFGDESLARLDQGAQPQKSQRTRVWPFLAAAALLATAMFLALVQWSEIR